LQRDGSSGRMPQTRTRHSRRESPTGFKCQMLSTRVSRCYQLTEERHGTSRSTGKG
jgi:hypothetical protein